MSKDPAVLFYTSDFLSGTSFFSMEERGQYITLLCEQHQLRSIPEDHLIKICGSLNSPVAKKFTKNGDGTYYQHRMKEESEKRRLFCESRRKSIKKRYVRSTYVDTSVLRMENENENRNIDKKEECEKKEKIIIPDVLKESFEAFSEMRKSIRKPLTEHAKELVINKLEKMYPGKPEKQIECLNQSTLSCYQGLFDIKKSKAEIPGTHLYD